MENLVINFFLIWSIMKVILFAVFLDKSDIWGKSGSWDMSQNGLGQSDCRIFKSTRSLEQSNEKAWFFACWYKFMEIKSWLKCIGGGRCKKWVWLLWGNRTQQEIGLKLDVSQQGIYGINWFTVRWYNFRKAKSYFHNFWVIGVKTGCDIL